MASMHFGCEGSWTNPQRGKEKVKQGSAGSEFEFVPVLLICLLVRGNEKRHDPKPAGLIALTPVNGQAQC